MTSVAVNTRTHSVTYVADNILKSFKDILRLSGLDPSGLVAGYESKMRALRTWLSPGDLDAVNLEVFDPDTGTLIIRWDLDIVYGWSADDGSFWTDTDKFKYSIRKAGVAPKPPATGCCCKPIRAVQMWMVGRGIISLHRRHGGRKSRLNDRT